MPLWGWIIIILVVSVIMIPIKLRILKKIMRKNKNIDEEE